MMEKRTSSFQRYVFYLALVAAPVAEYLAESSQFLFVRKWGTLAVIAFFVIVAMRLKSWLIAGSLVGAFLGFFLPANHSYYERFSYCIQALIIGGFIGCLIEIVRNSIFPSNPAWDRSTATNPVGDERQLGD